ncbi:hypothetical protein [Paenibacillus aestuarii]|uniref:CopG family transcriptional regulator n=1 Tax=Paenibacillus aestuarii TaxID=516965 RepID=A0ABW0K2W9_9BACL|nr:hypothetical protein [Paenibacillus aestuarii]
MGKKKAIEVIEVENNEGDSPIIKSDEGKLVKKTFMIQKKLLDKIMAAMLEAERGEQTRIINKALKQYFSKRKKKKSK